MLFTTFLLATAAASVLALGALLARRRQPGVEPLRVPYGPVAVAAAAAVLTAVGLAML
jgi:hypothetical protein